MKLMRQRQKPTPVPSARENVGADLAQDMAPSPQASPAPRPQRSVTSAVAAAGAASVLACTLHGCDVPHVSGYLSVSDFDVATHQVAQWRMEPEYWHQNAYMDPDSGKPTFNSCMNPMLSVVEVCSGHGVCAPFDRNEIDKPVFFCRCDERWSGLECSHRRRRQSVAWLMSVLFGYVGLDEFYLGFSQQALQKLMVSVLSLILAYAGLTIIGSLLFGFSWMFDVVRIGLGPVMTSTQRVQADLPRAAFALLTIFYFCFVAVAVATAHLYRTVLIRRRHFDHVQCYSATSTKPLV